MVGDVFCKHDECHGDERKRHFRDPLSVEEHEVHDLEIVHVKAETERGEDRRHDVTRADADDEGYELHGLEALLTRADDDGEEGDQATEESDEVVRAVDAVARRRRDAGHRAAGKRQTDECNGGSDDHGRHELGHPFRARKVDDDRDDDVHHARKRRADEDAQIAERRRRDERADEREGTAEEHRALEPCEEQIHKRTHARAEDGRRHLGGKPDRHGHRDGRRHDGEQLLQRKHDQSAERGLVVDVIDEIDCHKIYLPDLICISRRFRGIKKRPRKGEESQKQAWRSPLSAKLFLPSFYPPQRLPPPHAFFKL